MMTTEEKIAVMQAATEGKTIEFRFIHSRTGEPRSPWGQPVNGEFRWNWVAGEYRIAPIQRRKIHMHAWLNDRQLVWFEDSLNMPETSCLKRVPSEDKIVEVSV